MPALSSYTRRGQNNPWGRPFYSEASGATATPIPSPEPDPVSGPYMAFGTEFCIRPSDCMIGFNIDGDPPPDLWASKAEICASPELEDRVKLAISAQLEADGCGQLPCHDQLNP